MHQLVLKKRMNRKQETDIKSIDEALKPFFSLTNVGVALTDSKGRFIEVNNWWESVIDYPLQELYQRPYFELVHPEDMQQTTEYFNSISKGRIKDYRTEKRYLTKSGSVVWVDLSVTCFQDKETGDNLLLSIVADITDSKLNELKLLESKRELSDLIDNLPGFVYRCKNNRDWEMLFMSKGCEQITGYPAQAFLSGKISYSDLIDPDWRNSLWENWQKILGEKRSFEVEYPITDKQGNKRWMFERGQGIFDSTGHLLFLEGFIQDVSDRKKMEFEIHYQTQLQQLVTSVSYIFINANPENVKEKVSLAMRLIGEFFESDRSYVFRFTENNKKYFLYHEWTADGISPSYEDDIGLLTTSDYPWWFSQFENGNYIQINDINTMPIEAVKEQEVFRSMQIKSIICIPIIIDKIIRGFIGLDSVKEKVSWSAEQITMMQVLANIFSEAFEKTDAEKKLLTITSQLKELNSTKDKLFSIIAHDLRGPFSGVMGLSELLYNNIDIFDEDEIHNSSKLIYQASVQAFGLLENLLEWTRLQRDKVLINFSSCQLKNEVDIVITTHKGQAEQKEIKLNNHIPDSVFVRTDSNILRTVIRNLTSNAIKFTEPGGEISFVSQHDGDDILFSVKDSGIGIPDKHLETLFELSENGREGTAGEPSSGLGLILVKELLDKTGNTITAISKVGKGTEFIIRLQKIAEEAVVK